MSFLVLWWHTRLCVRAEIPRAPVANGDDEDEGSDAVIDFLGILSASEDPESFVGVDWIDVSEMEGPSDIR